MKNLDSLSESDLIALLEVARVALLGQDIFESMDLSDEEYGKLWVKVEEALDDG